MIFPPKQKIIRLDRNIKASDLLAFIRQFEFDAIGSNSSIPIESFPVVTSPDWNKEAQGIVVIFAQRDVAGQPQGKPILSRFFAAMCCPLYQDEILIPGQNVLVTTKVESVEV